MLRGYMRAGMRSILRYITLAFVFALILPVFITLDASATSEEKKLMWGKDKYEKVAIPMDLSSMDGEGRFKVNVDIKDTNLPYTIDFFIMTSKQFDKYKSVVDSGFFTTRSEMKEMSIWLKTTSSDFSYSSPSITQGDTYYLVIDIFNRTIDDFVLSSEEKGHTTVVAVEYTITKSPNYVLYGGIIAVIVIIVVTVIGMKIWKKVKAKQEEEKKKLEALKQLKQEEAEIDKKLQEALMRSQYSGPEGTAYPGVIDPETQALLEEQRRKKMQEEMEFRQRELALQQPQYPQQMGYAPTQYPSQQMPYQSIQQPMQQYPQQQIGYSQQQYPQHPQHPRHPPQQ